MLRLTLRNFPRNEIKLYRYNIDSVFNKSFILSIRDKLGNLGLALEKDLITLIYNDKDLLMNEVYVKILPGINDYIIIGGVEKYYINHLIKEMYRDLEDNSIYLGELKFRKEDINDLLSFITNIRYEYRHHCTAIHRSKLLSKKIPDKYFSIKFNDIEEWINFKLINEELYYVYKSENFEIQEYIKIFKNDKYIRLILAILYEAESKNME